MSEENQLIQGFENLLKSKGSSSHVTLNEATGVFQKALSDNGGKVGPTWGLEAIRINWHYAHRMDKDAATFLAEFEESALQDNPSLRSVRGQRFVVPAILRAPAKAERNSGLVGRWQHTEVYRSGDFTGTTVTMMALSPNGAFLRGGQSFFDSVHRDSEGNWDGWSTGGSGGSGGERGHWATDRDSFYLVWPQDGSYEVCVYEYSGSSLLLTSDGENTLWKR